LSTPSRFFLLLLADAACGCGVLHQVFQMPEISTEPVLVRKVKQFLGFDSFFEIIVSVEWLAVEENVRVC